MPAEVGGRCLQQLVQQRAKAGEEKSPGWAGTAARQTGGWHNRSRRGADLRVGPQPHSQSGRGLSSPCSWIT